MRKPIPESSSISWEINIPLVTNPLILRYFAGLFGAVTGFFIFLLAGSFAVQGKWQIAGQVSLLGMILGMGLYLFILLLMAVFYGNRQMLCFTLSDEGISCETINQRVERWNRSWIRRVLRGLTMSGESLKIQQEAWQVYWHGAFRALVYPARHCIVLRNRWRTLMVVYCTPENFPSVRARIDAAMAFHGTADRVAGKSPLVTAVWRTVLFMVAIFPILKLVELLEINEILLALVIGFGLAMIWLIPLMAWPILALIIGILGYIPIYLLQLTNAKLYDFSNLSKPDSLIRHGAYPRWQLLDGQEIFWIASGVAASVYLIWLASAFLHGRILSLMMSDAEDSGW